MWIRPKSIASSEMEDNKVPCCLPSVSNCHPLLIKYATTTKVDWLLEVRNTNSAYIEMNDYKNHNCVKLIHSYLWPNPT